MVIAFLTIACIVAAINTLLLFRINPKQDGPYPLIFFAIFIACTGHLFLAMSSNLDQAILANKLNYIGAIFMPLLTFDACLSVCKIRFPVWGHMFLTLFVFIVFALSATVGYSDVYYKTVEFVETNGVGNYVATYGPGHDLFNLMVVGFFVANVALIVYAFLRKRNVSYKSLMAIASIELASVIAFFVSRILDSDTVVMPAVYIFDQYALLYICFHVKRYNVDQTIAEALELQNTDGYVLITSENVFLGCNDMACKLFPSFEKCRIDHTMPDDSPINHLLLTWNENADAKGAPVEKSLDLNGKYYKVKLNQIPFTKRRRIHLFKIEDSTTMHRYINMLGTNNVRLELLLKKNDSHIRLIQEKMIVNMAEIVESRDSNTGSHIKRTSKVVSILADYLRKSGNFGYPDSFYDSLVSAAPMHDLGKIAIDDRILRKPGKFTAQEYEEMKTHPEKGAMIVENLLTSIEEPDFVRIACNVARYHHERYDGQGYPMKLKGTDIPFEARIMAIADVYDALVSKRCYKEAMTFADAYEIIVEGMGSQYDPSLRECFIACRENLEAYYKSLGDNEV